MTKKTKIIWKTSCIQCGCKEMKYHNYTYTCPNCGHFYKVK